jgi:hypothetical protein
MDINTKLDEVVGKRFDDRGPRGRRGLVRLLGKLLVAIACAVAMAFAIMRVLDVHLIAAREAAANAPRGPVPVQILPAK